MADTPLQAAIRAAFAVKAPKKSPAFTGIPTAPTAEKGTKTDQIATTAFVMQEIASGGAGVPTGAIMFFHATTPPDGWLPCNGQNVSRTTYANLFSVIGTTYGSGDGSTTFTLPNLHHRFLEGTTTASEVGDYVEAGLPNISGTLGLQGCDSQRNVATGCFSSEATGRVDDGVSDRSDYLTLAGFSSQRSSSVYGKSSSVQVASLRLLPCVKF